MCVKPRSVEARRDLDPPNKASPLEKHFAPPVLPPEERAPKPASKMLAKLAMAALPALALGAPHASQWTRTKCGSVSLCAPPLRGWALSLFGLPALF